MIDQKLITFLTLIEEKELINNLNKKEDNLVLEVGFTNILADMKNIGNMAETHAWHEYLNQNKIDELIRKIKKDEVDKEYKENRAKALQQNANTNEYKAKNGTTVTHVSMGGGKKTGGKTVTSASTKSVTNVKEAVVKMQAPNGKVYLVPESQIKRYKAAGGKIVG